MNNESKPGNGDETNIVKENRILTHEDIGKLLMEHWSQRERKKDDKKPQVFMFDLLHCQTIAMIISHMRPNQGAAIINGLPPGKQAAVIRHIITTQQASPVVIEEIKKDFENWLSNITSQPLENTNGIDGFVESLTDLTTGRNIMKNLVQYAPELVDDVCQLVPKFALRLMFEFEDIVKLSDADVQTLIQNTGRWATAITKASEELKIKIFKNMSKRGAKMLQEEIEYSGPQPSCFIAKAQQEIIDVIDKLNDYGKITLPHRWRDLKSMPGYKSKSGKENIVPESGFLDQSEICRLLGGVSKNTSGEDKT